MNLKSPRLIKLKAILFLIIVVIASALLLARTPEVGSFLLLAIALWAGCRSYYFAFYVLQHYVDPTFRYTGLWDLVRYLLKPTAKAQNGPADDNIK